MGRACRRQPDAGFDRFAATLDSAPGCHLADEVEASRIPVLGRQSGHELVVLLREVGDIAGVRSRQQPAGASPGGEPDSPRPLPAEVQRRSARRERWRRVHSSVERVERIAAGDARWLGRTG